MHSPASCSDPGRGAVVNRNRRRPHCGLSTALLMCAALSACGGPPPDTPAPVAAESAAPPAPAVAAPTAPRTERWIDLGVGECLATPPPTDPAIVTVTVVDCAAPHAAEVYHRAPVEVNAAIADVANRKCADGFARYTGGTLEGSRYAMSYLIDSRQDRTPADPLPSTVICLLGAADGAALTGSARGSG